MIFEQQKIESIFVFKPKVLSDHRGFFMETYRKDGQEESDKTISFAMSLTNLTS